MQQYAGPGIVIVFLRMRVSFGQAMVHIGITYRLQFQEKCEQPNKNIVSEQKTSEFTIQTCSLNMGQDHDTITANSSAKGAIVTAWYKQRG